MEKKLTVVDAAKVLGVSKEAIYNRLRRGTLQSTTEEGVKYILLSKQQTKPTHESRVRHESEGAYVQLLKEQIEELKLKNERLESDKERLIADKERFLIESKEKIETIYKERDEQLKAILSLANRQISLQPEQASTPQAGVPSDANEGIEEADLYDDALIEDDEDPLQNYHDWRDLRSYLKEKGFSKKEKHLISQQLEKKVGHTDDLRGKDGRLFIKKGKKLKEILGE